MTWPHFQGRTSTKNGCQILTQNSLSASYLENQMMDSDPTLFVVSLGQLKKLAFDDLDPICKDTTLLRL